MVLGNWKMDYDKWQGLECTAPCSMYSVLLEKGLIKDPFYGLNEKELTSLSDKGCSFECEFEIDRKMLEKEHIELIKQHGICPHHRKSFLTKI